MGKARDRIRYRGLGLLGLLICATLLLALGCGPASRKEARGKLKVVSTVGMIRDAVAEIGGEHVESIGLMGPGVDPHLYRATAGDVQKLENADVVFYGGLELEGRMTDIFVKMAGREIPTHAVSEGIPTDQLREPPEFHGKYDPHVWFDVTLWKHAVETIRDGLIKARPALREDFDKNSQAYLAKLDELHAYVQAKALSVPEDQRILVTAHDAFGYFGRQYKFEVIGIQGTSTATEAAAGSIRSIAETIARRKVRAIFVESSVPPATIEALQQAIKARGWQVKIGGQLFSDAMGKDGTPEGTYIGMVRHNIDTIVGALK